MLPFTAPFAGCRARRHIARHHDRSICTARRARPSVTPPSVQRPLKRIILRSARRTNLAGRRRILTDVLGHRAAVVTKEDPIPFTADDFCTKDRLDDLTNAALATSAFPIVFPVVEVDKAFYADGGLLDNQPVGHAIKAIRDKKAVYLTKRYVVFVEPNPDALESPEPCKPSPAEVALQMPMLGIEGNIWNAAVDLEDFNRRRDHYHNIKDMSGCKS